MAKFATVASVNGNAVVVGLDGTVRPLKVGDIIQKGEIVRTAAGARVELVLEDGQTMAVAPEQTVRVDEAVAQTESTPASQEAALQGGTVDQILQVLEQGGDLTQELEAAAAGGGAGSGGDGSDFVRLLRVTEGVDPLAYEYSFQPLPGPEEVLLSAEAPAADVVENPPSNTILIINDPEAAPGVGVSSFVTKEDSYNQDESSGIPISITATAGEGTTLTQIVLSGFAPGVLGIAGLSGLGVDPSQISIDDLNGVLTISGLSGTTFSGTIALFTVADSDMDLGDITAVTSAVGTSTGTVFTSAPSTVSIVVDAVADPVSLVITVTDSNDANSTFQTGETGTVNVKATFGDVTDGSETHTVTLQIPAGFVAGGFPEGLDYEYNQETGVLVFNVSGQSEFEVSFSLTNESAEVGDATITGTARAEEAPADGEDDHSDNVATANASADLTVADAPSPEISLIPDNDDLDVEGNVLWLKEDGEARPVTVQASTSTGSSLTQIVISGFSADFKYDFSSLEGTGITVAYDQVAGTVTITGNLGTSYSGTFTVQPGVEDSDADLGDLTAEVTAVSDSDPGLSSTADDTLTVNVDAVLDEFGDLDIADESVIVSESTDGPLTLNLGASMTLAQAEFAGSLSGGADGDSSESITVYITVNTGDLSLGVGAPAGASVTYNEDEERWELTANNAQDLADAVSYLQVTVPQGWDGEITGSITSQAVDTATDVEYTTGDNAQGDSINFAITVEGGAGTPTVSAQIIGPQIGEVDGQPVFASYVKEDVQATLRLEASTSDATDELTTVVVTGLTGWAIDLADLLGHADIAAVDFTGDTLTITLESGVTSLTANVLITPPEDSDGDITINVVANVQDITNNDLTNSATTGDIPVAVDAVLDNYADVSGPSEPIEVAESNQPQTVSLNLSLTMMGAGFTYSGKGDEDTDSSESVSVTVSISAGELVLAVGAAAGVELVYDADSDTYTLTADNLADLSAAVALLQVQVPANFDGSITGSITAVTSEANTPNSPTASEPDTSDNTKQSSAEFTIEIADSTPQTPANVTATVEEESIPGSRGINEDDGLFYKVEGRSLIGATDFGADGFGGIKSVTVGGIEYTPDGDNKIIVNGPSGAWVLTVYADTGLYDFEMLKAIDHGNVPGENTISLPAFTIIAQDGDGSETSPFTLTISVVDDVPVMTTAPNGVLDASAGSILVGQTNFQSGADAAGAQINISAAASSVDANGYIKTTYVQNGVTKSGYLTFDGEKLKYYEQGDGSLVAKTDGGVAVYTVSTDPVTGEYTVTMHVSMDALQVYAEFNTSNIKGGNGDFYLIGGTSSGSAVSVDLKATAYNGNNSSSETVNTRSNFFGVGTGQDINNNTGPSGANDVLVLEFGSAGSWNTSTGAATGSAEKAEVTSISFTTSAFGNGETLKWTAFLMDGTTISGEINGSGNANASSNQQNYTLDQDDFGGPIYKIEFSAGEGSSYDLGNVNVLVADGTVDQTTQIVLQGQDGDGDLTAALTINLTFSNDNTFEGGAGNDVLAGGSGDDVLYGGAGADVFQWNLGDQGTSADPAIDRILDFSKAQGDSLDLRDLLQGESDAALSQYLTFSEVDGKAVLNVSTTAGGDVTQKIVFDNMSLAQLQTAYEADSAVDLIAKMRAAGGLSTDN